MTEKQLSIVIIDDDNDLRGVNAYNFNLEKFEVFEGRDGLEGLKLIKEHKPDIVFTGINMPNMDGFELLKTLKADPATRNIPVLIYSHLGKDEDRKKATDLGASEFIVKGMITPVKIVSLVKDMLNKPYRVAIDPNQLDGKLLMQDYSVSGIILELDPREGESGEFKAKMVKD